MSTLSPCVNICQLDTASGLCIGCARTSDEIAVWAGLPDADRRQIMAQLPQRRALIRTPHSRCTQPKQAKRHAADFSGGSGVQ